jgi:hypothetical protein
MQQHQMIQQHRQQQAARQALMAQQYSGVMPGGGMPNGMNQMTPAQYAAMRSGPMAKPVNLPQHLQHAQAQAQHNLEQQQAQQQHQQVRNLFHHRVLWGVDRESESILSLEPKLISYSNILCNN